MHQVKISSFEGPLDLLLFLIRKNELDIYDIPIESVTRQYIDALHAMQQLDLDVAGEFFVMAASLMGEESTRAGNFVDSPRLTLNAPP